MDTSAISYRVADFLKKHPPFGAVDEHDLVELAARGRVRFHEPNEYILWQGEPHRAHVFVIQQGTVSLWDESGQLAELRDVRGAGDLLGLERFNDAGAVAHSARSESDVVIYAFPADEFEALLSKYPRMRDYVSADGRITVDYHQASERKDPSTIFLHALVANRTQAHCSPETTLGDAATLLLSSGAETLAVLDSDQQPRGILTARTFVEWIARGGNDPRQSVSALITEPPLVVSPAATVADGVLAIGRSGAPGLVISREGSPGGQFQGVVSPRDIGAAFGEQPIALLREIRSARSTAALRDLNHRVRAFVLQNLASPASIDWLSQLAHLADAEIVRTLVGVAKGDGLRGCWCFSGSSGRAESLTRLAPQILLILEDGEDLSRARLLHHELLGLLAACDYLPRPTGPFEPDFHVATVAEWSERFTRWVREPVSAEMYKARRLFDLRPILGLTPLWTHTAALVSAHVDTNFLHIVANDCLATLPPLTFFEDAVVDKFGEQTAVFHLEDTALRPLVDVGRVFAFAARAAIGQSTLERFATARALLPEQQRLFREAADTFRVVLWQQGRIGINEGTSGIDLPPSLLSRHDRHVLKSGFRSILELLQFTANRQWIP